jgi:hypothetical protein
MGAHINADGLFQSDKYPMCPPGKVPLSIKDVTAQDLLWEYAQRRRAVDAEFAADLEACLIAAGYTARVPKYVISHPSDRLLAHDPSIGEVWSEGTDPILFDTAKAARDRIEVRSKEFPNGDWPMAAVALYKPGIPRVYPSWTVLADDKD